jgi:hypothetical protein
MQILKELQGFGFDIFGYRLGPAATLIVVLTAVLLVSFAFQFSGRAFALARALKRATAALQDLNASLDGPAEGALDSIFAASPVLDRYWREYQQAGSGSRSALGSVFASEMLIDDVLKVDIFRHFPVILVGVAVTGLALGLFTGSQNAGATAENYAATIAVAMIGLVLAIGVAVLEYAQLKQCRQWLRHMAQGLDSFGGEATDGQARREENDPARGIKDGLADELNRLLAELGSEPAAGVLKAAVLPRSAIPEDLVSEMRAQLREMRSGFAQSLLELAEANRALREQVVRMLKETEARQQRILDELNGAAGRARDRDGTAAD